MAPRLDIGVEPIEAVGLGHNRRGIDHEKIVRFANLFGQVEVDIDDE